MNTIPMSQKELDKHDIIKRLMRHEINGPKAASLLKLSTRQVRRLKSRVRQHGAHGLVHGNRGKLGNRKLPDKTCRKIVSLLHKHYADFKPTFAAEKLRENHGIDHDPKTIRTIMIDEGLWKPKIKRTSEEHRAWRKRRDSYGEMDQFDGSYEYWFEDRGPKCCLLAAIDDATGKVVKAEFAPHEGVIPVFTFWKEYLEEHGKPRSIYLDKFSTYKMNSAFARENHELKTRFERVAEELCIELIFANSPQAKGRVERLFQTFQDRLIKEMRLARISNSESGNVFLKTYLPKFNAKFSVPAIQSGDLHTKLNQKVLSKLPAIFSRQDKRVVQNDFTVSYHNSWYQLLAKQPVAVRKKETVIVERRLDDSMHIRLKGKYLAHEILPERPKRTSSKQWVLKEPVEHKPSPDHPWRRRLLIKSETIELTNQDISNSR